MAMHDLAFFTLLLSAVTGIISVGAFLAARGVRSAHRDALLRLLRAERANEIRATATLRALENLPMLESGKREDVDGYFDATATGDVYGTADACRVRAVEAASRIRGELEKTGWTIEDGE